MTCEYTVTSSTSFMVDGSVVAERMEKLMKDWQESPMDLIKLCSQVYLDGVKHGLELAGMNVKEYKTLNKERE